MVEVCEKSNSRVINEQEKQSPIIINEQERRNFIIKFVATLASTISASCLRTVLEFFWR